MYMACVCVWEREKKLFGTICCNPHACQRVEEYSTLFAVVLDYT